MDRRGAWTVGAGVLVAALLVLAASSGSVAIVRQAPDMPWENAEFDLPERVAETPTDPEPPPPLVDEPTAEPELPFIVSALALGIIVVVVAAGASFAVRAVPGLWRERLWVGWRRPESVDEPDEPDGPGSAAVAVVADAELQRELLQQGEPRAAIVACWLRLESAVASAGVVHHRSDTSTELTERVLAEASVDRHAIRALAALYREARFSTHPMGEPDRAAALAALDAVHVGLGAGVPA
ncbi:MAG TPA: DUF4129 domain-containing protein [Acidimicrobiales bacterium]